VLGAGCTQINLTEIKHFQRTMGAWWSREAECLKPPPHLAVHLGIHSLPLSSFF